MNEMTGKWLGWLGIIAAVIGFFVYQFVLGGIGIVLGLIGLASQQKGLNWTAVVLGVIAILVGMFI